MIGKHRLNKHQMPPEAANAPWIYAVLLAAAVSLGLPAGPMVLGAGALFGPGVGLLTVLGGQALGLTLNWRLCRGVMRPRILQWLEGRRRGRRLGKLLQQQASLRLLLLLRLALIPMNLVNVASALGPTPLRPYALASLMLVPRFSVMVWAGALGAEAVRGTRSPLSLAMKGLALAATAAVLLLLGRGVRRQLQEKETGGEAL
jgi:uncharacterized membrane protein YdjX (TVP38/TMEM64 family)